MMGKDLLSRMNQEMALVLALEEAQSRTLLRLSVIFDGIEAVTNSGIENPITEMVKNSADMVNLWRVQIASLEDSEEIFAFIQKHRLDLSWSDK